MAYRLEIDEPLAGGFRRIVAEQLGEAGRSLEDPDSHPRRVHECRKSLKRTRALLRLMRCAVGKAAFKKENERLRDAGRLLSPARDLETLADTLALLEPRHDRHGIAALRKLREAAAVTLCHSCAGRPPADREEAGPVLRAALASLSQLELDSANLDMVGEGLERSYGACRRAFATAYEHRSDDAFHEWRKTIQYHWRHMQLLSPTWPEAIMPRARAARQLSTLLGEDHDLAVLADRLGGPLGGVLSRREREWVTGHCQSLQAALRARTRPLGERLLCERAGALRRRIIGYWHTATRIEVEARRHSRQVVDVKADCEGTPPR